MIHLYCAVCLCICAGWMGYVRWDWGAADGDTTGGGGVFAKGRRGDTEL